MGFYQLQKEQLFKESKETLWSFISDPRNLEKITPEQMGFTIVTPNLPAEIYQGMMIQYKVAPLLGIKTTWVSEISQVEEGIYFVDEQRIGPYKLWHHQHILEETKEGTLMKDIISYQPPFGLLGNIANSLFIKKQLEGIFAHRSKVLSKLFKIG